MHLKWYARFMRLAREVSTWSKDDSTKVGSIIVEPKHRTIRSVGYNGFPRNFDDTIVEYQNRPLKYVYTEHSERNAIFNAARSGVSIEDCWIFCTHFPCPDCARGIIQSGIVAVVCGEDKSDKGVDLVHRMEDSFVRSLEMLENTGVMVTILTRGDANLIKATPKYFKEYSSF